MGAKAVFDIYTRVITLIEPPTLIDGESVVVLDVAADLYGDGKEDWKASELFRRVIFPLRAVGGDATPTGKLDGSYFLRSDWKIQPYNADHRLRVNGNFYSEDGKTPFLVVPGRTVMVEQNLSAIVGATYADENAIIVAAALAVEPAIFFDEVFGVPGTTPDVGTRTNPVNNVADALTLLSSAQKGHLKVVEGTFQLSQNVDNLIIEGLVDPLTSIVDFNGFSATRCSFVNVTLTGDAAEQRIVARSAVLLPTLTRVHGYFHACQLKGMSLDSTSGSVLFLACVSHVPGSGAPQVNANGRTGSLEFRDYTGGLDLYNLTSALCAVSIDLQSGHLKLDASCTNAASFVLRGVGKLTDASSLEIDDEGFTGAFLPRILSLVRALIGLG